MQVAGFSETSLRMYETTRHHIPEHSTLHGHHYPMRTSNPPAVSQAYILASFTNLLEKLPKMNGALSCLGIQINRMEFSRARTDKLNWVHVVRERYSLLDSILGDEREKERERKIQRNEDRGKRTPCRCHVA
jgi:hypothetical protein